MEGAKKRKIKASSIVDGVLLALGGALLLLELSFVISSRKDGMPSLFGKTFLRVLTGSMDGPDTPNLYLTRTGDSPSGRVDGVYYTVEDLERERGEGKAYFPLEKKGPWMFGIDTAAILERKSFESVEVGDVVTFYFDIPTEQGLLKNQLVSHRVIEIVDSVLYCYGDAYPKAGYPYSTSSSDYQGVQRITKEGYVGVITSKSDFLGGVMVTTSSPWFVPAIVGIPLLGIGVSSLVDVFKERKKVKAEEDRRIQALVSASGVSPEDELAYQREVEKASIKVEIQMEMEQEKEKQMEIYRKQFEKAKKQALKDMKEGKE